MPGGDIAETAAAAAAAASAMEGKEKKKTKKRRSRSYLTRPVCFSSTAQDDAATGGPRFDRGVAAGGGGGGGRVPTHLVVMVNGLIGSAGDWRYAAKKLVKSFPDDVVVFRGFKGLNPCSEGTERLVK